MDDFNPFRLASKRTFPLQDLQRMALPTTPRHSQMHHRHTTLNKKVTSLISHPCFWEME